MSYNYLPIHTYVYGPSTAFIVATKRNILLECDTSSIESKVVLFHDDVLMVWIATTSYAVGFGFHLP